MKKFKASRPAFDPPESIKNRREETLRVFAKEFGMTELAVDTIRIMTETFFKAGMDRTVELKQMVDNGEMEREDFDEMIDSLKGGEDEWMDKPKEQTKN